MTVQIKINGRSLEAEEGMTVLQAARLHGIEIPTLCHHPNLKPAGSCRLCLVELEPRANLATACTLPVQEGTALWTETPRLVEIRKSIL
ncbi:MAG: molybdopterin oxidoreductase, partial [Acidobacteria bacterium]|nr:molybdopterin oxidoreductase [Acidobacteriota bacterium]